MPTRPMNPTRTCSACGAPLPADAPPGHCPKCLLALALDAQPGDATRAALEQATLDSGSSGSKPSSTTLQFKPGEQVRYFGDYELIEEIARGGMGVVWKARQQSLNRIVAVKMIRAGKFAGEAEVKRFRTEAEAAANLQHPNIVAIHEVGEHEGQHYFSMDYVEGRDLAQLVKAGPLPVAQAARYVQTIAGAIAYAHQRGTLHRDLKPHNVLVDQHDQPRITDFGLAKLTKQDSSITQEGAVMGSPSYMPPEQAAGRQAQVGPPSDVYAIGAVLYHLVTGQAPFLGATAVETLRQVMDEEPVAPTKLNAKVPADLETICLKCLRKEPAQRYATAQEVADELARFLNFEPILAKPANPVRRVWHWTQKNPWVFAATFATLLLLMACVAFALWEKSRLLAWRMKGGRDASPADGESAAMLFFKLFPGVCLLLYLAGNSFRKLYRDGQTTGAPVPERHLFSHGALGVLGAMLGMGHLFLQIRSWVWLSSPPLMLALELAGVGCALALNWMAVRMVWEAVGIHETSRFRGTVDTALGQQMALDAQRWSPWRLLRLVLWMLLAGGVAFLLHEIFIEKGNEFLTGAGAGLVCGFAAGWLVLRVICHRARPFTNLFVPGAVGSFVIIVLGLAMARGNAVIALAAFSVAGFVLGALGQSFFGAKAVFTVGESRRFPGHPRREAFAGLALFVGLFVVFHLIENWRGRREWLRVKADLEARGESLDYDTFLKPPVPDEQNVMAHPYMKKHFIRWAEYVPLLTPDLPGPPAPMAYLRGLPRERNAGESLLRLVGSSKGEVIPFLQFTNQPLAEVFAEMSRRAGIKLVAETNGSPWVGVPRRHSLVKLPPPYRVQAAFTNATPVQIMDALARAHWLKPDVRRWQEGGELEMTADKQATLQGILDYYGQSRSEFAQIEEALQRPHSWLEADRQNPFASPIPNFVTFRATAQAYATLVKVHCLMGNHDDALRCLRTLRRLVDAEQCAEPPTLVQTMISVHIGGLFAGTVEETLAEGLWPASQLEAVQQLCTGTDLSNDVLRSFRGGERAAILRETETSAKSGAGDAMDRVFGTFRGFDQPEYLKASALILNYAVPQGWVDQNKANYARAMQLVMADYGVPRPPVRPGRSNDIMVETDWDVWLRAYRMLSLMGIPNFVKVRATTQRIQTHLNLAYTALALERHRAAKGAYQDTLAALVPEFAATLPHDLFDGQPLRYRRTDDGRYLLYSVGPNLKDDGGDGGVDKDGKPKPFSEGPDWVWRGVPKR